MTSSFTSGQMHEAEIVSERVRKILGDRESQDLAIAAMTYTTALLKYEEQWTRPPPPDLSSDQLSLV